jgi:prepilin-type N-terminal cleavage/methylation domain-containing protein
VFLEPRELAKGMLQSSQAVIVVTGCKMKIRRNLPNAKAFTLVEVILSLTIMGIAGAGLMACFTGSFCVMRMARENQRATQVLMERAEALRVFSWTQVTNTSVTNGVNSLPTSFTDYYTPTTNGAGIGAVYRGTISNFVPTWASSYQTNMREIDLSVKWTTDGITRTRTLTTYVARDGMQNYVY